MAYSVVVLDDEPLILEGLTKRVDWAAMNCEVVGSALNGLAGKELLERLRPDLVISDIKMPGLTGMDLAELNYKHGYASKFLILTAYSDFAYAQKAIRYQVEDYILKPIDVQKLREAVLKAVRGIEEMERREQKVQMLEEGMKNTKELVTASLLFNIARYSGDSVDWEQEYLNNCMMFGQGVFLFVRLYNIKKEKETNYLGRIQNEIVRRVQEHGTMILKGSADDKLIFLCQLETRVDAKTARNRIAVLADRILVEIGEEEELLCTGVVSGVYKTKVELNERYQEGAKLLKESYFAVRSGVMQEMPPAAMPGEVVTDGLLHHLKHGNQREMNEEYNKLCKALREMRDADYAAHVLKELHHQAAKTASGAGMVQKPAMDQRYCNTSYDRFAGVIGGYLNGICQYIGSGQNLIGKVKLMVEECYGDSQFGLSTAAQRLGVNSSYLSRLFKKETDENFVDYLVDVRIGKAEYLLETTKLKNSEISALVGFEDERYFGKVFKKKCNVTPKQYRERKGTKFP